MRKIRDKVFDIIIIFGLIFLVMQISIITSNKNPDSQSKKTIQTTPPSGNNESTGLLPNENKKQVSTEEEQKKDNSIDL